MEIIQNLLPNFSNIFYIAYLFVFKYYGWVIFVLGAVRILWHVYYHEIQHQYVHQQEWVFLQIKVPKENMVSTLAVEQIFNQLHVLHGGKTFIDLYAEGQIQLWYSLEIVSFGGKISFIIRTPKKVKDVVEAAFYSQYPQAEISEIEDYMANFNYDPENPGDYEFFGMEWKLDENEVLPIKTYKDFEHPAAEETIVDPLSLMYENLAKIAPYEFMAFQIIIQPLADEEWHFKGINKIKELIGEEAHHEASFLGFLMSPFEKFSKFNYSETLFGGAHGHGANENKPKNNWMSMTETEKERVSLIEKKIGKPGYKTKIRTLYIAPKDKFDNNKRALMPGPYRALGSINSNKLKPDTNTWTGIDPMYSKTLEQFYLERALKKRKKFMMKGYKNREIHIGRPMFVLNVEELATLYHFPITTKTTLAPSSVEKTESKRSQPPANLPISEL